MNPQKNQGEETSPLFRDLQAEVSSESAPLLQFMLRHAGIIAARTRTPGRNWRASA